MVPVLIGHLGKTAEIDIDSVIPLARVRKILKADKEMSTIADDAVFVIAKSTVCPGDVPQLYLHPNGLR